MKLINSLTLLIFVAGHSCQPLWAQNEEDITLQTATGEIHGTLLSPQHSDKIPVALIIAGSGPTDRDGNNPAMTNNTLRMLAEGLGDNNIASLRFDKRGIGASREAGLKESELTFLQYVEDVKGWIGYLSKLPQFDKIFVVGHSEGSLIGMLASQDESVMGFVSLSGVGRPASEILKEQILNQSVPAFQMSEPIIDSLAEGHLVQQVPNVLHSLFRPSVQPYIISWFRINPQVAAKDLLKPVLIVQGDTDIQVGIEDAKLLHQAATQSSLEIVEGMNHILKIAPADRQLNLQTYNQTELPLHHALIPIISAFIFK